MYILRVVKQVDFELSLITVAVFLTIALRNEPHW